MAWYKKRPKLRRPSVKDALGVLNSLRGWPSKGCEQAMSLLTSGKNIPANTLKQSLKIIEAAKFSEKCDGVKEALKFLNDRGIKPTYNQTRNAERVIRLATRDWSGKKLTQLKEYAILKGKELKHFNKIIGILKREWRLFVKIHNIAEELHEAADDLDKKNKAGKYLKQLEYFESFEQMWASVSKLGDTISKLEDSGIVDAASMRKITDLMRQLKRDEARVLYDTVQKLDPVIAEKGTHIVDWNQVKLLTEDIIKYSQAFVAVDSELRKFISDRGFTD